MFTLNSKSTERSESVSNPSSSNEINNILLVGNGFDLAVGLKTSYSDFVKFLAIKIYLSNVIKDLKRNQSYQEWIISCLYDKKICDSQYANIFVKAIKELNKSNKPSLFDEEKLNNILDNQFMKDFLYLVLSSYVMKILTREDTISISALSESYKNVKNSFSSLIDFEKYVSQHPFSSNEEAEEQFSAKHDFYSFLTELNKSISFSNIKQWVDVESFIEFLVTNNRDLSVRFYPERNYEKTYDSLLFDNPSLYKEYFKGLEDFCNLFKEYLCTVLNSDFVWFPSGTHSGNIKAFEHFKGGFESPYSESLLNRSHGFIEFSKILNIKELINYNYTYTAEAYLYFRHLYGIYNHTYHVNGELDYDFHYQLQNVKSMSNHLVFGFSNTNSIKLKSTLHTFEKKVLRVIKNTTPLNLDKLTSKPFNLLIYGHSCGVADGDVIGKLLKSSKLQIAVVLCYDQESLVSITNNLIEIVEPARFDELISNANQKVGNESLYFAVRNE